MDKNAFYEELLELSGLRVDGVEQTATRVVVSCHFPAASGQCPQCAQATAHVHQYTTRMVRDLNILHRETWLHLRVKRFVCVVCNCYFSQCFPFAAAHKSYTHRQARWLFDCCARQPFAAVGALVNMVAKTVERIYYEHGRRHLHLAARYAHVRRLGIDEIAHRKGKGDYCCVLTDLDRNIQLDILPNRTQATLIAHFEALGPVFCQQIQAVSCDMWPAYRRASLACFPNARLVIDRFHVVKALNQALDRHRQDLRKGTPKEPVFKDLKWALFKARPDAREAQTLQAACAKDLALEELVGLRQQFHALFEVAPDATWLYNQLTTWAKEAHMLALPVLAPFLKTLANWQEHIANFAESRLTNAATEGLNNIIRYVKRISFGLPNFEHMRLRVLLNHG